jgi:hypothetical protein
VVFVGRRARRSRADRWMGPKRHRFIRPIPWRAAGTGPGGDGAALLVEYLGLRNATSVGSTAARLACGRYGAATTVPNCSATSPIRRPSRPPCAAWLRSPQPRISSELIAANQHNALGDKRCATAAHVRRYVHRQGVAECRFLPGPATFVFAAMVAELRTVCVRTLVFNGNDDFHRAAAARQYTMRSLAPVFCHAQGGETSGYGGTSAGSPRAVWICTRACSQRSSTISAKSGRPDRPKPAPQPDPRHLTYCGFPALAHLAIQPGCW